MKKKAAFIALVSSLLFDACAVRQDITLLAGAAGSARLEAELHPVFMAYYRDLASGFDSSFDPANPRYFNMEAIEAGFRRNAELRLDSARAPQAGKLVLDFHIRDISAAVKNETKTAQGIISRESGSGGQTLSIRLNRDNLSSLLKVIPEADSPLAKMLLPPEGAAISENEYIEHLAWALEDYAKDEKIEDILRSSAIRFSIKTPGKIVSHTGGKLKSEREILFEIPIPRLFTLEKPLGFSVTY
ncbi:MAG: hypothetical protein LBT33_10020 [Spirochaetia bacterium]|jgi:hypothetical protein|nr:hypothetical protein [Spirochaetia bacterium]